MPIDDPNAWAQGAGALRAVFESIRSAIGLVKDAKDAGGTGDPSHSRAIDQALDHAERAAGVAEAEIAKALEYELCRCDFPPTPMRTVGYIDNRLAGLQGPVYECPKCCYNTATMWAYMRIAPERT